MPYAQDRSSTSPSRNLRRLTLTVSALVLVDCGGLGWAVENAPRTATLSIDAGKTERTFSPRRLGGSNFAGWFFAAGYTSPEVRHLLAELRCGYIRLPGGSWANGCFWNGNGVRRPDGTVDSDKLGPDGYPAIDYSAYAPSVLLDSKTWRLNTNGWHGNVDVTLDYLIARQPSALTKRCATADIEAILP